MIPAQTAVNRAVKRPMPERDVIVSGTAYRIPFGRLLLPLEATRPSRTAHPCRANVAATAVSAAVRGVSWLSERGRPPMTTAIERRMVVSLPEIAEQRERNWPDFHPEDYCHRCGGRNVKSWHAPSPVWNAVMEYVGGDEQWNGIICPQCLAELADEAGIYDRFGSWCFRMHDPGVPLPTIFKDGRVWDAEKCLWVERETPSR